MSAVPTLDSRIACALRTGARNTHALCQVLGVSTPTMECVLQRMKREGHVRHRQQLWHLPNVADMDASGRAKPAPGIGSTQRRTLLWLIEKAMTASDLAQRVSMSRTYVLRMMDGLERRKLVTVEDGVYVVTEAGRGMVMEGRR